MTVYLNKNKEHWKNNVLPFGTITAQLPDYSNETILDHRLGHYAPENDTQIEFNIVLPHHDIMQQFVKWQRYRKFWWSSVTTTPSLFKIDDIQQENSEAKVNIIAQFPFGSQSVEYISVIASDNCSESKKFSLLKCKMSLEGALFILLLDGCTNYNKEKYLKLHRKMAPYKFAFALDTEGVANTKDLGEVATLLQHKLQLRKITSLIPNFFLPLNCQISEILQVGVPYTAILNKTTLENGIFKLINSNTMLKEQVHVADFDNYAAVLCSGK
ncbi:hypothetical protein K1T71_007176 [Dendrolimus kikuchii]|uniref:Uncharacterized protein n=1 Tax=Dendrolimus kikuchii TaxID=765133 RepID=A0ACC1CZY7_9NEOP|nr:hypothetical protein K1T71_007176 [Dendrolimus kikuchii]